MKFNSIIPIFICLIPAFARKLQYNINYSDSYSKGLDEDNFSMKDIVDTAGKVFGDTDILWNKYDSKEKAIKPYPNYKTVKIPDVSDIRRHWGHASFVYCINDSKPNHLCSVGDCKGFNVTRTFENKDLQTFVIVGLDLAKKEIIISHRGSQNTINWLSNFDYKLNPMDSSKSDIKVHSGFLEVYQSNEKEVNKYLQELLKDPKYKGFKVIFTGHSLGAGVTTIHAAKVASSIKDMGNQVELYPYHSPRVGDKNFSEFVSSLNIAIARYTNRKDPINRLPGRSMSFSHILGELHLPSSDKSNLPVNCDQKFVEDPNCALNEVLFNIEDHNYAFGINRSYFCGRN